MNSYANRGMGCVTVMIAGMVLYVAALWCLAEMLGKM
jgi:hypothetical protein